MQVFFGFKQSQDQVFDAEGKRLVVTKIAAKAMPVVGRKSQEKAGYEAVQVALGQRQKLNRPVKGIVKRWRLRPRLIREVSLFADDKVALGDKIKPSQVLTVGDKIKATALTKGRGFAGVMKRWGFAGGPKTHGQSDRARAPGSIGQGTDPGRVWKGKKMAGRFGGQQHTVKNLRVIKIDEVKEEIWLTGVVPGPKGGLVKLTKTGEGKFAGLWADKTNTQPEEAADAGEAAEKAEGDRDSELQKTGKSEKAKKDPDKNNNL